MIVSVKKLKQHIDTALEDVVLEDKLLALELLVRKYPQIIISSSGMYEMNV